MLALLVGAVVTVALLALGTFSVVMVLGHEETSAVVTFPAVRRVVVRGAAGSITLRGGERTDVQGTRLTSRGLTSPTVTETVTGDTLTLTARCAPLNGWCSVSYDLDVPRSLAVDIDTSAGAVSLSGLEGSVRAHSTAGAIRVDDVRADTIDLESSAGSVRASGLRAAETRASSSAGSVRLAYGEPPRSVDAHSSAGSVDVELPEGDTRYRVDATSSTGTPRVRVDSSPTATNVVSASSSAGSVTVHYPGR